MSESSGPVRSLVGLVGGFLLEPACAGWRVRARRTAQEAERPEPTAGRPEAPDPLTDFEPVPTWTSAVAAEPIVPSAFEPVPLRPSAVAPNPSSTVAFEPGPAAERSVRAVAFPRGVGRAAPARQRVTPAHVSLSPPSSPCPAVAALAPHRPAAPLGTPGGPESVAPRRVPVVVVVALDPRYGATTVARGLAAALAGLDSGGVAVVTGAPSSRALGSSGARRLSRTLAPLVGPTKAIGRLCFADAADPSALLDAVRHLAPVVLDAGPASRAAAVAPRADAVVLVASGRAQPALAAVVARSLSRIGPVPWCVVERGDPERWSGRDAIVLPTTRLGARRVRRGAPAGGEMGRALTELAERCGAAS